MANYQQLKAAIAEAINNNGQGAITGQVLQDVLIDIVDNVGGGYVYAGIATPTTVPQTTDTKVFYIATQGGVYSSFGGVTVVDGLSILKYDTTWQVQLIRSIESIMAGTTGDSTVRTMTQAAITQLFNSIESRLISNVFETVEEGFFVTDFNGNIGFSVKPDAQNNVIVRSNTNQEEAQRLRVLTIGNSFSTDALAYVPPLLKSAGQEFVIGYLYIGGCTLETHLTNWNNNSNSYTYFKHTGQKWTQSTSKSIGYALDDEYWDIVIFHQESSNSGKIDSIMPYLPTMISRTKAAFDGVKIGWLMTPAWGTQNSGWSSSTYQNQSEMYAAIVDVAKKVRDMCEVDFLIPEVTAIQNARGTSLDSLGADLFASTSDRHLEDGTGRLIAAMTVYNTIWKPITGKSLMQVSFLPKYGTNVSATSTSNYFYPHTVSFTAVTAAIAQVAKACANAAMDDMFNVTNIYEPNNN